MRKGISVMVHACDPSTRGSEMEGLEAGDSLEGHVCTTLSFVPKGKKLHEEDYICINLSLKISVFDKMCNIGKEESDSTRQKKKMI